MIVGSCLQYPEQRQRFHYNLRRQLSPPKTTSVLGPEQSLL